MKSAMKHRMLQRDEMAYSDLPESGPQKKSFGGRQPSDLIQSQLDTVPLFQTSTFKPALDEFLKNGPSSDVEKVKNLAAEIAAMSSQIDPSRVSTELDNTFGIGNSRNFGPMRSGDNMGFSISSFSSLVDFGDLDAKGPQQRNLSWQKSVSELMPDEDKPENYHKEYKCYESGEKKRLMSKEWTIDFQQSTTTFTPTNEASSELTSNVVTHVQLNDMDQGGGEKRPRAQRLQRPQRLSDRQMSVEINTANVGIDSLGRLGSYELVTTQLNMQPNFDEFDPVPLPPQGYQIQQQPDQQPHQQHLHNRHDHEENMFGFHQQNNFDQDRYVGNSNDFRGLQPNREFLQQQFQQPHIGMRQSQFQEQQQDQYEPQQFEHEQLSHRVPQLQRPPPVSQGQTSISTQIQGLGLVVPPRTGAKLESETGVIDPQLIQDSDVLLERGGKGNHHKGSKFYRRLINERRNSYQELPDSARAEKMAISLSVVMSLKATGARFIHKRKGQYIVIGDREARNKISQALREKKERVMLDD